MSSCKATASRLVCSMQPSASHCKALHHVQWAMAKRCISCSSRRAHIRVSAALTGSLTIATRGSKLALEQANQVQLQLNRAALEFGHKLDIQVHVVETAGDRSTTASLREMGQGAFTKEVDAAVLDGKADIAVHSLKDAPVYEEDGLCLAACLPREDTRDVLIAVDAKSLGELMPGSRVGTSSTRRRAQILHRYPHLEVVPFRGNVDIRLKKIICREMSASILSYAGLKRLGQVPMASSVLSSEDMLPAAAQGAIGIMCREQDEEVKELLQYISHAPTMMEVLAERACVSMLIEPDSTDLPKCAIACHAMYDMDKREMSFDCLVSDPDGKQLFRLAEAGRYVGTMQQAEDMGFGYGRILAHTARANGWI